MTLNAFFRDGLIGLVKLYRLLLSPWLGSGCRFEPTCSLYAIDALQQHGAARGSWLTVCRLARCHPWCEGGCDPVPPPATPSAGERQGLFTRLLASESNDCPPSSPSSEKSS
ncbi:membrane protein insertion efficiency factor YidD [Allofranklinella schreckenbergeri]|uniref:Putative membrane protein insertion efficiency factor n=1 Tax=Allofranklinella schreckenbergeri TaxID=1076744 RepID=A0A3M6QD27_9BURK|nr:membrane protein insertion efficiency factor YidD [Allofranklinella schreckenbergeri]RMX00402.1 membrane protein insertion efficiency factor YidD [Allofranklinella schreckenbergeri]